MYWILYRKSKNAFEFLRPGNLWVSIEKLAGNELMLLNSWPEAKKISTITSGQPLLIKDDGKIASEDEMRMQIMADIHKDKLGLNSMERLGVSSGQEMTAAQLVDKWKFYI